MAEASNGIRTEEQETGQRVSKTRTPGGMGRRKSARREEQTKRGGGRGGLGREKT